MNVILEGKILRKGMTRFTVVCRIIENRRWGFA